MRISDWSSDVCSSDLLGGGRFAPSRCVQSRPAHSLASVALGDFDGDGNMDAVVASGQNAGHYRFDRATGHWSTFHPFDEMATTAGARSEEHTSELQSLMRISYAVFCLKTKTNYN